MASTIWRGLPAALISALVLLPAPARGQDPVHDGFRVGLGLDVSAVDFDGDPDRILGGTEAGPGLGHWLRVGYAHGPVAPSSASS